jgi:hypothetical protein
LKSGSHNIDVNFASATGYIEQAVVAQIENTALAAVAKTCLSAIRYN